MGPLCEFAEKYPVYISDASCPDLFGSESPWDYDKSEGMWEYGIPNKGYCKVYELKFRQK